MRYFLKFKGFVRIYHTRYHAEQMARALTLNGTAYTLTEGK